MTTNDTTAALTTITYTSAAEDASKIRAELKRLHGYTSRQISVKADTYSMGSSIDVTIKAPGITLAVVKEVAEKFDRVRRCEYSGEILSGGNRFVNVKFDRALLDDTADGFMDMLEALPIHPNQLQEVTVGEETFLAGRTDEWRYSVTLKNGDSFRYMNVRDIHSAAQVLGRSKVEQGI